MPARGGTPPICPESGNAFRAYAKARRARHRSHLPDGRRYAVVSEDSQWTLALSVQALAAGPLVKNLDDVRPDSLGRTLPAHRLLFDYLWSLLHMEGPETLNAAQISRKFGISERYSARLQRL